MKLFSTIFFLFFTLNFVGQDTTLELTAKMLGDRKSIRLAEKEGWIYKKGHDISWATPEISTKDWKKMNPNQLTNKMADKTGKIEGWFRLKVTIDDSLAREDLFLQSWNFAATDVYIDGKLIHSFGNTGRNNGLFEEHFNHRTFKSVVLQNDKEYLLAIHYVDFIETNNIVLSQYKFDRIERSLNISPSFFYTKMVDDMLNFSILLFVPFTLAIFFWIIFFFNKSEIHLLYIALTFSNIVLISFFVIQEAFFDFSSYNSYVIVSIFSQYSYAFFGILYSLTFAAIFSNKIHKLHWLFVLFYVIVVSLSIFIFNEDNLLIETILTITFVTPFLICVYYIIAYRKTLKASKWALVIGFVTSLILILIFPLISKILPNFNIIFIVLFPLPFGLLIYVSMWLKESQKEAKDNNEAKIQVTKEKNQLLENQTILLEKQVNERTTELQHSLNTLKSTQSQLIQSEKMASLGELTAGIAHEIQNPLNFVNNFSELSVDLAKELKEEAEKSEIDKEFIIDLATDLSSNQEKINYHGKRASSIVKSMLEHSRKSSGTKEPTDINALADEYLRLAYHGLRAKDNHFNATMETHFDPTLPKIDVIPQDIGRVLLNLITNAFYAVDEKANLLNLARQKGDANLKEFIFEPKVTITTRRADSPLGVELKKSKTEYIQISIKDNGPGIPDTIKDKIFQPFFTTKPTGQGTGLGLSLAYDIVKSHGGELKVGSTEDIGTTFNLILPI